MTLHDFEALWTVLQEIDGFAFYNGGRLAGASQPHKHLQVIPLPFVPDDPMPYARLPIDPVIQAALPTSGVATVPILPFQHAIAPLQLRSRCDRSQAVKQLQHVYHALLQACDLAVSDGDTPAVASGAYNLLATRDWMFLVPRSAEAYGKIGINSLGFAGALLVKNEKQLAKLKQRQPLELLTQVAKRRSH